MSYLSKWLNLFPKVIGNQTRSDDGIDNTLDYNTDGFPQRMANDPVRYDLENAVASQLLSNDERLKEEVDKYKKEADANLDTAIESHNKDVNAHADIRTKIGMDIGIHNKNGEAHSDIRTKIGTDIGTHNKDAAAHADIRQLVSDTVKVTSTVNKPESMADNGLWCEIIS
ncbi:hypothetical protein NXG27_04020 [Megasphaera paucivorans]|uniref:Uncharacterized protein n=1 Tax=Megasphaera paucivorans TaxID=349095 RepID=A0A1G9QWD1_9FIRM|nr:hypothetical protein [Megasphaera paucivorans]SDM15304.1 hypothetical protein SAMN05660299_00308 [Megasphaera paucivorans]